MTRQYKSEALAAAHEAALGLSEAGVMPKQTMRVFDEMCLTPVAEMTADENRGRVSGPRNDQDPVQSTTSGTQS